ncbi:hypothetical protein [Bifidobacterium vansinderenii]|uniref:DUF433 domain-containing protein n=1 Tax=Bifidobacterium vansinderenii TaxID=1984871 RepID=A0A229W1A7_9BIFI|nr:hypothetical protein [Bifidobacterium vansinderenii]OXN01638.1 hypothetical protein Tam10B_0080 [Bifidobacterium vansinderenii]
MIGEHVARIIIRWWNAGLTIQEIQELNPFVPYDDIAELIGTYETRKDQQ